MERNELEMRSLEEAEITAIYQAHMRIDFPPAELKPLETILAAVDTGAYQCYGFYREEQLVAYAYFMKHPKERAALLDYFAVIRGHRNTGIGSQALQQVLTQEMAEYNVLIEAEWPEMAESAEERTIRERRVRFYRQNGMKQMESIGQAFGVDYTMFTSQECTEETLMRCYLEIYCAILPEALHDRVSIGLPQDSADMIG